MSLTGTGFKSGMKGAPAGPRTTCKGCGRKRKIVNKELGRCDNCTKMHPVSRNAPKDK